jgi:YD repeat-containing protein
MSWCKCSEPILQEETRQCGKCELYIDRVRHILITNQNKGESETKRYDAKGNLIYFEMPRAFWYKWEYDDRGNKISQDDTNGFWWVAEYDEDNHQTYYEDVHGCIIGFRKGQEHIKSVNKALNSNVQGWCPFAK